MFHWSQLQLIYASMLQDEANAVDKLQSVPLSNKSLLQLSLEQEHGSSVARKFRHPCLRRIHFLISSLITEIGTAFQNLRYVDNDTSDAIMQHFSWLRYFVRVCRQPVGCRTSKECISEIALHWHWLYRKLITSLTGVGFQFSQQLSDAMWQLQSSLGIDEVAVKIQGAIQSLIGQPRPFHSSSVADAFSEAYLICRRLERKSNDEVDNVRINLRCDIQKMKLRIADSLLSLDHETVDSCVAETKDLLNALHTNCDVEDPELSTRVSLYRVCQLLAEMREAEFAAESSNHVIPSSADVSHFVRYCSQRTIVSPLTLCCFKYMLPSSARGMDILFNVSRSLIMRSVTMQEGDVYADMLCCNVSRQILSVVCASSGPPSSYSAYSCLPDDFTIGDGDSRCSQLSNLNQLLWTNAELLFGPKCSILKSDCRLLTGTLRNLLSSLQSLLPTQLFNIVDSCLASTDTEMYAAAGKRVSAAAASSSKLMMLVPDWPSQLGSCLQRIGCVHLTASNHCKNAALLGAAWVEVGLFKMQLLAPRGAVDPSYRLAVKLEYAGEQLRWIERSLRVDNWQSALSSGQELPAECHPMVERMYRQQAKLRQWISEKSQLVAHRPELARYLALLRDIRQFVCGLGSPERIRDLVKRLLQSSECDSPTQGAIDEFTTLKAAVSAFVSRIEQEYLLYCDICVPFLTAVVQAFHGVQHIVKSVQTAMSRQKLYSVLHCKPDILDDFVRRLVQFPVSCENLKSGLQHAMCRISFDSLLKFDVTCENAVASSQVHLRYISYIFLLH